MSDKNPNETVSELAFQAAGPELLSVGEVYAVADGDGKVKVVDTDAYAEHPRLAKANRVVNDAESFNKYLAAHGGADAEVWADTKGSTVVGVIDAHAAEPGWEAHTIRLTLEKSTPWLAWEAFDGQFVPQVNFAEFIDMRAIDVVTPAAVELIELAQFFQVHRKVEFKSTQKLKDGETTFNYEETLDSKAGQKGNIAIPDNITLALRPYIGGPMYYVNARFRYRLNDGVLALGVLLERPQEILDAAFADIVTLIREGKAETPDVPATAEHPSVIASKGFAGIPYPIYYGKPSR